MSCVYPHPYLQHFHHHQLFNIQVGKSTVANGLWTAVSCQTNTMLGICEYDSLKHSSAMFNKVVASPLSS